MNKEISLRKILPVMFGFFIMGFVDIVGVSTSYVKNDFAGMERHDGQPHLALLLPLVLPALDPHGHADEPHRS